MRVTEAVGQMLRRRARAPKPRPLASTQGGGIERRLDVRGLEAELRRKLAGEVHFDDGYRAMYATDSSNYRQVPIGVVFPKSLDDVVRAIRICRQHGAPILSRGGGTSLAGQCCNVAVVIEWTKHLGKVLEIDAATKTARVQPGTVLDDLRRAAAPYGLTFGPDPATHNHCTLGGMIGNNSCGIHAQMAGPVSHNVHELDVLTYDGVRLKVGPTTEDELRHIVSEGGRRGQIYAALRDIRDRYGDEIRRRYPRMDRRISGYNLDSLLPENGFDVAKALVGTESTCVTILEAKLRLVYSPPHRVTAVLGFEDIYRAGDVVPELDARFHPLGLEGLDERLVDNVRKKSQHERTVASLRTAGDHGEYIPLLPGGQGWLLLEMGGDTQEEAKEQAREVIAYAKERLGSVDARMYSEKEDIEHIWAVRESGLGATARVPGEPDTWEGWEDSAVPPENVGKYLRGLRALFNRYGYGCALYGHFGQGCVHTRIDFQLKHQQGIDHFRSFLYEAADLVLSMGGSLSGEHGDGQSRGELLPKMFGDELMNAFRAFKRAWDPDWKMNPGKVIDANPLDGQLRMGAKYSPWQPKTHFQFPDDKGVFATATERCVGVGKCRREEGGTMCPSYMVTRDEKDTTRGRAHILFEMLQGEVVRGGWKDQHVMGALELCLSCKGCKGDCPVNVDMATYKAEYLSHHYQGRLRPRPAYAMGLIMFWARAASVWPEAVNFLTHTPPFRQALQKLGGLDGRREIPKFAPESFQHWARRRPPIAQARTRRRVILWPDTFNNFFFPETGQSALEVLEAAGFQVEVPQGFLCCGRPLYDFGMLPTAKWMLRQTLRKLEPEIQAGVPVVGLEPSCVSVFRDELRGLFPTWGLGEQMRRQTFLFSEFWERYAKDVEMPRLERKAVVHGHCHHKSLFKMEDEKSMLRRMGLEVQMPDTGCCGMAGAFGYEAGEKYEVSQKAGERVLLPKVRSASEKELVIADGFSCREMILQNTDRKALHVAQVLDMARKQGPKGPEGLPEHGWVTGGIGKRPPRWGLRAGVIGVGVAIAATVAVRALRPQE